MPELKIDNKLHKILQDLSIQNVSELIRDYMMTEMLYKLSDFTSDVKRFEKKYSASYTNFKEAYEREKEDFKKYDDLMAWKFAEEGKNYWSDKIEELKNAL